MIIYLKPTHLIFPLASYFPKMIIMLHIGLEMKIMATKIKSKFETDTIIFYNSIDKIRAHIHPEGTPTLWKKIVY